MVDCFGIPQVWLLSHRNCDVFVDNAGGYERDIDGVC
jgi:hypothetical protein